MKIKRTKKSVFPRGIAVEVHAEIGKKVSLRTIQHILAGTIEDNHNVLEIAIRKAKKIALKKEKVRKQLVNLAQINKSSLTPKTK